MPRSTNWATEDTSRSSKKDVEGITIGGSSWDNNSEFNNEQEEEDIKNKFGLGIGVLFAREKTSFSSQTTKLAIKEGKTSSW